MLVLNQKPPAPERIDLGRGVFVHVRPLTAIEHGIVFAHAEREARALVDGRDTQREWPLSATEIQAMTEDEATLSVVTNWMRSVLLAETAVVTLEGVSDEDGAPVGAGFEAFAWLLSDPVFESVFRVAALVTEQLFVSEKNVFGRGLNGSGATASTTVPDAAPSAIPAPAADASSTTSSAPGADALKENTPLIQPEGTSSGASATAPASGGVTV